MAASVLGSCPCQVRWQHSPQHCTVAGARDASVSSGISAILVISVSLPGVCMVWVSGEGSAL